MMSILRKLTWWMRGDRKEAQLVPAPQCGSAHPVGGHPFGRRGIRRLCGP